MNYCGGGSVCMDRDTSTLCTSPSNPDPHNDPTVSSVTTGDVYLEWQSGDDNASDITTDPTSGSHR
jgi:hypothetical protein